MHIVIREQPVNSAVFAETRACRRVLAGGAFAAGNDAGDNFVAELHFTSLRVGFYVFADLDDFTGTFVTENDAFCAEPERIALVFVSIGSADAASFNLDQHFIITDRGDRILPEFKFAGFDQHCNSCCFSHFFPFP